MALNVGFIGLGNQGTPIARRIACAGFSLCVYDLIPEAMARFEQPGSARAANALDLARAVDVLGVCVRTDADLLALVDGGKLFEALGDGGIFIIHSTVSPALCRSLAEIGSGHGVAVLDAGVSGGAEIALAGGLLIMVGGDTQAFERALPVLQSYGRNIHHLGPSGRGMEAKLVNNLVSIANYELAAATLDLCEGLGFDREAIRQTLLGGSAQSFALEVIPRLVRPEGAASLRTLLGKDFAHAATLADEHAAPLATLGPAAQAMLDRLARIAAEAEQTGSS